MPDLVIDPALRGSGEFSLIVPANTTSFLITVPIELVEWESPHRLLIETEDSAGWTYGASDNTSIQNDKQTGLPVPFFYLQHVTGIELESALAGRKAGRTYTIDGLHYRQVVIDSPLTVRITVDATLTYGLNVTLGTKASRTNVARA